LLDVSKKPLKGTPEGGYEPNKKMTRGQALKVYTLSPAFGAFEEEIKGSIKTGKLADVTIFSQDLMTIPESEILKMEVSMTILGGKVVYQKKD
jgi:predicted amidohydrolase YtcJ